jgi:hypothetical protein
MSPISAAPVRTSICIRQENDAQPWHGRTSGWVTLVAGAAALRAGAFAFSGLPTARLNGAENS